MLVANHGCADPQFPICPHLQPILSNGITDSSDRKPAQALWRS
jgi:hypothetical protein